MRYSTPFFAAAVSVLSTGAAYADFGDQIFKLLPGDGAADDWFGARVAISGDTAIIGAVWDDDNGRSSGSAYLFDITTGKQIAKLLAADGEGGDGFGFAVSLSGDTAIVGAFHDTGNQPQSGSAYIFQRDFGGNDNWGQVVKLTASDAGPFDIFGRSVSLSGDTAIVGAEKDDHEDNDNDAGSAYIFQRDFGGKDNWGQVVKLTASDAAADDRFGWSVSLSSDTAILGAIRDDDNGNDSGAVYIFQRDAGGPDNWGQVVKLTATDAAARDFFGNSVSLSGDTAIVGAYGDDDNGRSSGSAYIFKRDAGGPDNWGQVLKLTASDAAANDLFGISVAIIGDTAIVGAEEDGDNGPGSGSTYLFDTTTGRQIAKLLPDDGAAGDEFGNSVALTDTTAIVGAVWDDDKDNGTDSGSAYLFDIAGAPSPGDLNCDGTIDNLDIEPFLLALFDPDEYAIRFPDCDINLADVNGDGSIDAFDIEPFLDVLFP